MNVQKHRHNNISKKRFYHLTRKKYSSSLEKMLGLVLVHEEVLSETQEFLFQEKGLKPPQVCSTKHCFEQFCSCSLSVVFLFLFYFIYTLLYCTTQEKKLLSGDYSTMGSDYSTLERDSGGGSRKVIRSVDASQNSLDVDDYVTDESIKKVKKCFN